MRSKTTLHLLVWVAVAVAIVPAAGDTITTKVGDTIRGTVRQFRHNHHATAISAFVVEGDGEEQTIPLHKIETITFEPRTQQAAPGVADRTSTRSSARQSMVSQGESDRPESDSGGYWLTTSSGRRHNASCRYYNSSKGRPCGPNEGTACKVCGG